MKSDTHIHCEFSGDSNLTLKALCKKAIAYGYKYLAITEHFDLVESEVMDYGILPLRKYFQLVNTTKESFPQLHISIGLEVGEPHYQMDYAQRLFTKYQPEYIIGSLHMLTNGRNISLQIEKPLSPADVRSYYEENLAMVERGGFDTLGHLGIYKRGLPPEMLPNEDHVQTIIDQIFRVIISKGIALEVNNSGYKSRFANHIPDPYTLKRYKQQGGNLICLASDSHTLQHFDRFYNKTLDSIKEIGFMGCSVKRNGKWELI